MAYQKDQRKLDELLDSALSEYSAVEPRAGLESRIFAHIQESAKPQARWWSVRWLVAGAVATAIAVLVLSVWLFRPIHKPIEQVARPIPSSNEAQTNKEHETPVKEGNRQRKRAVAQQERREEPQQQELAQSDRPAVFPTPDGLSEQEKLMLAYVAQTPKEELISQLRTRELEKEEFWKDQQSGAARSQR